jgi:hypothetical protein
MWTEVGLAVLLSLFIFLSYTAIRGFPPGLQTYHVATPPVSSNGLDTNQAKFMFFHTLWCPYCVQAQPIWASFKETLKNNPAMYGGKKVSFEEINCDTDKGKRALYKIDAYPTFKLETSDKLYTYSGKPSVQDFDKFLIETLGSKKSA